MSGSHKEFPKKPVFVQLGLAALVGAGFLFADKPPAHAMADKEAKPIVVAAAKVLAPIGKVEVKEESAGSAARSGEEIYASTCGVCHNNGVAGAPKFDDKASWETRLSGGYSALIASAISFKLSSVTDRPKTHKPNESATALLICIRRLSATNSSIVLSSHLNDGALPTV